MKYMKIVIKLCDTNLKKTNEADHLYKSGSEYREQRENRVRYQKQTKHELAELREKVEEKTKPPQKGRSYQKQYKRE